MEVVKRIRETTGLSFGEIKKALDVSGGDEQKALQELKKLGASMASKKSGREVGDGIVEAYIHSTKKVGSMIEVLCETDFVTRNEEFKQLAKDLAMHVAAMKPADVTELLGQPFVKNPEQTVQDLINQTIAKVGENIQIGQISVFEI